MPKSVKFFRNTCPHCNNDVGIPLLGDFAYAEFVFQTEDGKCFSYSSAIDHPAWKRVKSIFLDSAGISLDQNNENIRIYQDVLIRCADFRDGKGYTTDFPLCSTCGMKITFYNDDETMFDQDIPDVTWNGFLALSSDVQASKVLSLINDVTNG